MKSNSTLKTIKILACVALAPFASELNGQKIKSWPTASETLTRILADTSGIPLILYPPGYLEWLASQGDTVLGYDSMTSMSLLPSPGGGGGGGSGSSPLPCSQVGCDSSFPNYVVVDLGSIIGGSVAYGINESGQAVGTDNGNSAHAFLHSGSALYDLGTLGGAHSVAWAINSAGYIVGYSQIDATGLYHAFLHSGGSMQDIGNFPGGTTPYGSYAYGINDAGHIVGSCTISGNTRPFLYKDGTMQNLGTLGGNDGVAWAINSYGQVVGRSHIATGSSASHAFLYYNGSMQDLGTLGGTHSIAYAINDCGQIVGQSDTGTFARAVLWSNGSIQSLDTMGRNSIANDINSCGHIVGAFDGSSDRAFLCKNGTLRDLNELKVAASGWTLKSALDINDKGQIVGYGINPSGQQRAFRLDPLPLGTVETIHSIPPQPTYGSNPVKGTGKDSLIVVTHGRIPDGDDPNVSTAWVDSMVASIAQHLSANTLNNWQVFGFKWIQGAEEGSIFDVLENAKQQGQILGNSIVAEGFIRVHLIAHSAGAGLIQTATDVVRQSSSNITIHETFLDPYVGPTGSGAQVYGNGANWAENYFTKDTETDPLEPFPFTEFVMQNTYNVDVTQLDSVNQVERDHFISEEGAPCYRTKSIHNWPIDFYANTIAGTATSEYSGYGFPLSQAGGNWNYALANYAPGNGRPGNAVPLRVLGTPDPVCFLDIPVPTAPSWVTDFIQSPSLESVTGTIEKFQNGSIKQKTSSPAWLATFLTTTNPVNLIYFDAEFQSTNGAQGLLTVYWDTNIIGSIDERAVKSGPRRYTFRFPRAETNSSHMLGFRIDPFTNIQSIVVVTNASMSHVGPREQFSLSLTPNTTNGLRIHQLSGEAGFEYGIQASSNLINWTNIATLLNTNGTVRFFDKASTNYARRFYRAVASY